MKNTPRAIILGAILPSAASLKAGELVLVNGDATQGTTVAQTDSHFIWLSDNFVALTIDLKRVASINGGLLFSSSTMPEVADARSVFSNSLRGELSVTGAYAIGNKER